MLFKYTGGQRGWPGDVPKFEYDTSKIAALGWRAIRMGLDRPGLLRTQLRAMLRAAAGRDLKVMIPMVSTVAEFLAAELRRGADGLFPRHRDEDRRIVHAIV